MTSNYMDIKTLVYSYNATMDQQCYTALDHAQQNGELSEVLEQFGNLGALVTFDMYGFVKVVLYNSVLYVVSDNLETIKCYGVKPL